MMQNLKLCSKPNHELKQLLFQNGFKTYNGVLFKYQRNVGNDLIAVKILIDLENKEVELNVFDKNTMDNYWPFYNNLNGENNEFAVKVIEEVDRVIDKFTKSGIFRKQGGKK